MDPSAPAGLGFLMGDLVFEEWKVGKVGCHEAILFEADKGGAGGV
jgi:hypothetical protein